MDNHLSMDAVLHPRAGAGMAPFRWESAHRRGLHLSMEVSPHPMPDAGRNVG